jgi:hypothetical protein
MAARPSAQPRPKSSRRLQELRQQRCLNQICPWSFLSFGEYGIKRPIQGFGSLFSQCGPLQVAQIIDVNHYLMGVVSVLRGRKTTPEGEIDRMWADGGYSDVCAGCAGSNLRTDDALRMNLESNSRVQVQADECLNIALCAQRTSVDVTSGGLSEDRNSNPKLCDCILGDERGRNPTGLI